MVRIFFLAEIPSKSLFCLFVKEKSALSRKILAGCDCVKFIDNCPWEAAFPSDSRWSLWSIRKRVRSFQCWDGPTYVAGSKKDSFLMWILSRSRSSPLISRREKLWSSIFKASPFMTIFSCLELRHQNISLLQILGAKSYWHWIVRWIDPPPSRVRDPEVSIFSLKNSMPICAKYLNWATLVVEIASRCYGWWSLMKLRHELHCSQEAFVLNINVLCRAVNDSNDDLKMLN